MKRFCRWLRKSVSLGYKNKFKLNLHLENSDWHHLTMRVWHVPASLGSLPVCLIARLLRKSFVAALFLSTFEAHDSRTERSPRVLRRLIASVNMARAVCVDDGGL